MRCLWFFGLVVVLVLGIVDVGLMETEDIDQEPNLRAKNLRKFVIKIDCACGGEDGYGLYLIFQILYFPDTNQSNTKDPIKGDKITTDVKMNDYPSAYFDDIFFSSKETNNEKIGAYVEVWKDGNRAKFLGSATLRYKKAPQSGSNPGVYLDRKSNSKFDPKYRNELKKCVVPKEQTNQGYSESYFELLACDNQWGNATLFIFFEKFYNQVHSPGK